MTALSETRIETWAERAMDRLDHRYLTGRGAELLTTADYERGCAIIARAATDAAGATCPLVALHTLDKAAGMLGSLGSVYA